MKEEGFEVWIGKEGQIRVRSPRFSSLWLPSISSGQKQWILVLGEKIPELEELTEGAEE